MRRREFIAGLGSAAVWPGTIPAQAQTPNRIYRLGHITNNPVSERRTREIILPELKRLGFEEGRNLVFDGRIGEVDAMPGLLKAILESKPDAIIAIGPTAMLPTAKATRTVPIVTFGGDPTEMGLAQSYARPDGNVTGVVILISELEPKRLSILREAFPERRRVALLTSSQTSIGESALRKAAPALGVELLAFPVTVPADNPAAFAAMQAAGAQALLISATSQFNRNEKQLAALAIEAGLPTICEWGDMARAGCMIGYGPNRTTLRIRMAAQLASIFRGTRPGDIAIERPTLFEFVVNLRVAKVLGITIPPLLLAQADEVIE